MEQRTFEGTWEEITRRGSELAGRKVRITVPRRCDPGDESPRPLRVRR